MKNRRNVRIQIFSNFSSPGLPPWILWGNPIRFYHKKCFDVKPKTKHLGNMFKIYQVKLWQCWKIKKTSPWHNLIRHLRTGLISVMQHSQYSQHSQHSVGFRQQDDQSCHRKIFHVPDHRQCYFFCGLLLFHQRTSHRLFVFQKRKHQIFRQGLRLEERGRTVFYTGPISLYKVNYFLLSKTSQINPISFPLFLISGCSFSVSMVIRKALSLKFWFFFSKLSCSSARSL